MPPSQIKIYALVLGQTTFSFFLFFFFLMLFGVAPRAYGSSQARGQMGTVAASLQHSHSNARSLTHWATSVTYTATPDPHSNARSLTHWARLGMEPATSWFLVGFVNHWATMETPSFSHLFNQCTESYCSCPPLSWTIESCHSHLCEILSVVEHPLWGKMWPRRLLKRKQCLSCI